MRYRLLLAALALTLVPLVLVAQTPAPQLADVASPEAVVRATYESIVRRPGQPFDWTRFRALFLPGAMMIPSLNQTDGETRVLTVAQFIAWVDENTTVGGSGDLGFDEHEVAQHIERYGDIAQVFSTYEKRFHGASEMLGRGINSFQLVRRDGRWWIASVIWDEEAAAGPVPARYMPR